MCVRSLSVRARRPVECQRLFMRDVDPSRWNWQRSVQSLQFSLRNRFRNPGGFSLPVPVLTLLAAFFLVSSFFFLLLSSLFSSSFFLPVLIALPRSTIPGVHCPRVVSRIINQRQGKGFHQTSNTERSRLVKWCSV